MRKSLWLCIAGGWLSLVLIQTAQNYLFRTELGINSTWGGSFRYVLIEIGFWVVMAPVISWWGQKFPLERPMLARNTAILFFLNLLTALLHAGYRVPLHSMAYSNMPIEPLALRVQVYLVANTLYIVWIFWTIIGLCHAARSSRRFRDREQELTKAQLEMLKGQLQPHFLFNTLNSISWLMRVDVEAADNVMAALGELLRTSLSLPATQEITLREELRMLDLYLTIERARFGDRLKVLMNADPQTLDCRVPCLILQPIVENAVRHGIARLDARGTVEVQSSRTGSDLRISILDDGPGLARDNQGHEGIGLTNTRARLEKYYGQSQTFRYGNRDEGGLAVEICIPFRLNEMSKLEVRA